MPQTPERHREYMRDWRRKRKEAAKPKPPDPVNPADPIGALTRWSRENLVVPPGHPLAGEPMELPAFAADFLRDGWKAHESALTCGRKNAKSAICGILGPGLSCRPTSDTWFPNGNRQPDKRESGRTAPTNREHRNRVRPGRAALSEIPLSRAGLNPIPGAHRGIEFRPIRGHSSSFDLVVVDETSLFRNGRGSCWPACGPLYRQRTGASSIFPFEGILPYSMKC